MAVITISRQYGSGGDELAARVSERLGYRYLNKALMAEVAAEMNLSRGKFVDFSEDTYQMHGFLERLFGASQTISHIEAINLDQPGALMEVVERLDETECITLVQRVIQTAYEWDNVVILGRGGQAILQDKPDVLHVRVQAPLDARVQRLSQRTHSNLGGAQDKAIKSDRASAAYLKRFYGIDWDDPMLYDLIINTGKLSLDTAVDMVTRAVQSLPVREKVR